MKTHRTALALSAHSHAEGLEAFCASGSSPTVHLLGAGKVGRAFLRLASAAGLRVVAVTDSAATVHHCDGLAAEELAAFKAAGGSLAARLGSERLPAEVALDVVEADVVVDATPTDPARADPAVRRCRGVLRRGGALALAAKDAVAAAPRELLVEHVGCTGINAVLGGTGLRFTRELERLRREVAEFGAVPNASTTAIIEQLEQGADFEQAVALARTAGLLEADAELDLSGSDAASKLAVVAGALWGDRGDACARVVAPPPHCRDLDPELVAWRAARGRTTRLVGRATRDREPRLSWEELERRDPLAVPSDRVAYAYHLGGGRQRLHVGLGLGPDGTAAALLADVAAFAASVARGGER